MSLKNFISEAPPSLEPLLNGIDSQDSSNYNLPSYSEPRPSNSRVNGSHSSFEPQLHEFSLVGSSTHPWATLRLRSSAPSAKSLPIFFEGQKICGEVDMSLRKPESIKSVVIKIKGIATVGLEERVFMQLSETVWHSDFGSPRCPGEHHTKFSGKLIGSYQWPFSIALPQDVSIDEKVGNDLDLRPVERLPPNMQNSGWDSAICYRLVLEIKRHGMFRSDSTLSTLFGYTPLSRPGAPSEARCRAYKRNVSPPGPHLDPIGWQILRRIDVSGTIFKQRQTSVTYSISLATPVLRLPFHNRRHIDSSPFIQLTYTRGSVLPLHLSVRSLDKQALDILSGPSAPNIVLRRKLTAQVPLAHAERFNPKDTEDREAKPLAKALWAPSNEAANDHERCLEGEILIPLSCTPSFQFGGFLQEYFIDVLPPSPAGFQPSSEDAILSRTPVKIASAHAEGVHRPRAYITPAHDVSRRVAHSDALASLQGNRAPRTAPRPSTGVAVPVPGPPALGAREGADSASPPSNKSKRASRRFSTF